MSRKLSPDERQRIIDLKLQRIPDTTIAAELNTTSQQITKTWKDHLDRTTTDDELVDLSQESITRIEQVAVDARRSYQRSVRDGDYRAATAFLREERSALEQLHRYAHSGADSSSPHPDSVESATRSQLDEMDGHKQPALAAAAIVLARTLDQGPNPMQATVARELRMLMVEIGGSSSGDQDGALDELIRKLSTPMGDDSNSSS
jgi:Tfp pilus assembly protein PilE